MKTHVAASVLLILAIQSIHAQNTDSLAKKLDSLKTAPKDSAAGIHANTSETAYNERTKMNGRVYFILLGTDFTQEITGPFHAPAHSWKKVAGFAAIEGGLFLLDRPVQQYAVDLMDRNQKFRKVSHYVTNFGFSYEFYVLAGFGIGGWVFHSPKMRTTTLLATQSYIVATAVQEITKFISGRQRPNYLAEGATKPRPAFRGPSYSAKHGNTSFPSGHTTSIFAAATVYAQEYRKTWVPWVSYSAATIVGLSRITENKHWISDVFAGAALGYVTGLQVVRNYHRYAYLQNHKAKTGHISFELQYNYDHVEPGVSYTFR